jgi:hypothetical protein
MFDVRKAMAALKGMRCRRQLPPGNCFLHDLPESVDAGSDTEGKPGVQTAFCLPLKCALHQRWILPALLGYHDVSISVEQSAYERDALPLSPL